MLNSRWMPNFHLLFHDLTKLEIGCERGFLVHRAMTNLLEVHFVLLVGFFLKNSWFSMQRFPRKKMSKESSFWFSMRFSTLGEKILVVVAFRGWNTHHTFWPPPPPDLDPGHYENNTLEKERDSWTENRGRRSRLLEDPESSPSQSCWWVGSCSIICMTRLLWRVKSCDFSPPFPFPMTSFIRANILPWLPQVPFFEFELWEKHHLFWDWEFQLHSRFLAPINVRLGQKHFFEPRERQNWQRGSFSFTNSLSTVQISGICRLSSSILQHHLLPPYPHLST